MVGTAQLTTKAVMSSRAARVLQQLVYLDRHMCLEWGETSSVVTEGASALAEDDTLVTNGTSQPALARKDHPLHCTLRNLLQRGSSAAARRRWVSGRAVVEEVIAAWPHL